MDSRYATMSAVPEALSLRNKPPPLRGYLKKQGEGVLDGWKKRYFLQVEEKLHYFTSHKDVKLGSKGAIDLLIVKSLRQSDPVKYPNRFELVTPDRVYKLETYEDSDKTTPEWMSGIAEWLEYIEFRRRRQKKIEASLQSPAGANPAISSLPANFTMRTTLETSGGSSHVSTTIHGDLTSSPVLPIAPGAAQGPATLEALLSSSLTTISDPSAIIAGPSPAQVEPQLDQPSGPESSPPASTQASTPSPRERAASLSSMSLKDLPQVSPRTEALSTDPSLAAGRPSISASVDSNSNPQKEAIESSNSFQRSRSPSTVTPNASQRPAETPATFRSQSVSHNDRAKTMGAGFNLTSLLKQEQQTAVVNQRATWHEPPEIPAQPTDSSVVRDRSKSLSSSKSSGDIPEMKQTEPVEPPKAPSVLDKIADAPINPVDLAMKSLQEQSGASLVMTSPAALIAKQAELQQSRPKTLQEMSEPELKQIYEEVLKEMDQEEEILAGILKQKGDLEQQIREEIKREEDQFKAEKSRLEKEISESDTMIEQYMTRVAQLDKELREKELECDEENWKLYMARESHLEHQYLHSSLAKEVESFREELAAREASIRKVQQAMDVARISQKKSKTWPENVRPVLFELKQIWLEKAEAQHRMESIERRIRRTQLDLEAAFKAKQDILAVLDREVAATSEAFTQLEAFLMERESADESLLDAIDELKDLFFHALVVGIKLEGEVTGAWTIREDVEPSWLENKAIIRGVDWRSWRGWIKREIIQSDDGYTYDPLHDFLSRLGSHSPKIRTQAAPDESSSRETLSSSSSSGSESTTVAAPRRVERPPEKKKRKPVVRKITVIEDVPDVENE